MTWDERDLLIDEYASRILDGMDQKELEMFAYDCLVDRLTQYDTETLHQEIQDYHPDLLENN